MGDLFLDVAAGMAGHVMTEEDRVSIAQRITFTEVDTRALTTNDDEDADVVPGRGFTKEESKMEYIRQQGKGDKFFMESIEHFNTNIFNALKGTNALECESLFHQAARYINQPIDPKLTATEE